jgi:hypothetical protein
LCFLLTSLAHQSEHRTNPPDFIFHEALLVADDVVEMGDVEG